MLTVTRFHLFFKVYHCMQASWWALVAALYTCSHTAPTHPWHFITACRHPGGHGRGLNPYAPSYAPPPQQQQQYTPSRPQYGAPQPYAVAPAQYGAPQYGAPAPQYGGPAPQQQQQQSHYGAPRVLRPQYAQPYAQAPLTASYQAIGGGGGAYATSAGQYQQPQRPYAAAQSAGAYAGARMCTHLLAQAVRILVKECAGKVFCWYHACPWRSP